MEGKAWERLTLGAACFQKTRALGSAGLHVSQTSHKEKLEAETMHAGVRVFSKPTILRARVSP